MAVIVNVVARGALIASNLCMDAYLVKIGLQGINFVAKNVFKSSRPEQFVVTLMGKAPSLVNRFILLIDQKIGSIAVVVSVASIFFLWRHLDNFLGESPKTLEGIFLYTHPIYCMSALLSVLVD